MAVSEVDEFGIKKIYPSNKDPNRARPWLLGIGDWKSRIYDWDGEITSQIGEDGFLMLNVKNYKRYIDLNGKLRVGSKDGRGRKPVLAIPIEYDMQGNPKPIVTERNQRILRKRGYMGTPADWKNVEITLYAKVNDVGGEEDLEVGEVPEEPIYVKQLALVARGGPRHSSTPLFGDPCQGCSYYTAFNVNGRPALAKELFHDSGGYCAEKYDVTYKDESSGCTIEPLHSPVQGDHSIRSRWIGMKGIFYTNEKGNPQLELWVDKNNENNWGSEPIIVDENNENNWGSEPIIQIEDTFDVTISCFGTDPPDHTCSYTHMTHPWFLDAHGWFLQRPEPPPGTPSIFKRNECGGEANERIIWGGPAVKFRWDYISDIDIKFASVREIIPPKVSLRKLLEAKEISFPVGIREVAEDFGLTMSTIYVKVLVGRLL